MLIRRHNFTEKEKLRILNSLDLFELINCDPIPRTSTEYVISIGKIKATDQYVKMKKALSMSESVCLINEFKILCKFEFPSVQSVVGLYLGNIFYDTTLVTPLYEKGTLRNLIQTNPPEFNLTAKIKIIIGVSFGMRYLHEINFIHYNLKADNICLDQNLNPVITGFEVSNEILPLNSPEIRAKILSYMTPEGNRGKEYTKKSNVYSFGILMYEIFTGLRPYQGLSPQQIQENLTNGIPPEMTQQIPQTYSDIIRQCISNDPNYRPTFEYITEKVINSYSQMDVDKETLDEYKNNLLRVFSSIFPATKKVTPTQLFKFNGIPFPGIERLEVPIKINKFESVLRKAENRPIALVMLLSSLQTEKMIYLKTLTGDITNEQQTEGVLIYGPYIVSDLINRMNEDYNEIKGKCNTLNVDPQTAIFFMDLQLVENNLEIKSVLDKVNTIFTSISTICFTICSTNISVNNIKPILTNIRRAQLLSSCLLSKVYFLVKEFPIFDENDENFKNLSNEWMREHNISKQFYSYDSIHLLPLGNYDSNFNCYVNTVYQSLYYILSSIVTTNYQFDQLVDSLKNKTYGLFSDISLTFLNDIPAFRHEMIPNTLSPARKHCCNCCLLLNDFIMSHIQNRENNLNKNETCLMLKNSLNTVTGYALPYIIGEDEIPFYDYDQYSCEIFKDLQSYVKIKYPKWGKYLKEAYSHDVFSLIYQGVVNVLSEYFQGLNDILPQIDLLAPQVFQYFFKEPQKNKNNLVTTLYPYIWERNIEYINPKILDMNNIEVNIPKGETLYIFYEQPNHNSYLLFQSLTGIKLQQNNKLQLFLARNVNDLMNRFVRHNQKGSMLFFSKKVNFLYIKKINQNNILRIEEICGQKTKETIFITSILENEQIQIIPNNINSLNVMLLSNNNFLRKIVNKKSFKEEMYHVNKQQNIENDNEIKYLPIHAKNYNFENNGPKCVASIKYACRYLLKDSKLIPTEEEIQEYENNQ